MRILTFSFSRFVNKTVGIREALIISFHSRVCEFVFAVLSGHLDFIKLLNDAYYMYIISSVACSHSCILLNMVFFLPSGTGNSPAQSSTRSISPKSNSPAQFLQQQLHIPATTGSLGGSITTISSAAAVAAAAAVQQQVCVIPNHSSSIA